MVSERQQAADDLALDVELDRGRDFRDGEAQGGGPARLDGKRLGDAKSVIGRLQTEIIEERDLNSGIGAERPVQQPRHSRSHRRGIVRRANLHDILVQPGAGNRGHGVHPAVRREGPARAEQGGYRCDNRNAHAPKIREHGSSLVCR